PGQSAADAANGDGSATDCAGSAELPMSVGQYAATSGVASVSHRDTADGNALCGTWSEATVMGSSSQRGTARRALRNRTVAATGLSRTSAAAQLARCWNNPSESRSPCGTVG